jgi:hypothetical protein
MANQAQSTGTDGQGETRCQSEGMAADTDSYGPAKDVRRIKGLADLRRAYRCPSCGVQGRPLKRVWGIELQVAAHSRSGYVKYMGPDWDVDADPYECRHCGEPWWVWDRYERAVQADEIDAAAVVCAPLVV